MTACSSANAIGIVVRLIKKFPAWDYHANARLVVAMQEMLTNYTTAVVENVCENFQKIPTLTELQKALDDESLLEYRRRQASEREARRKAEEFVDDVDPATHRRIVAGFRHCIAQLKLAPDPVAPRLIGKAFRPLGPPPYPSQAKDPEFVESLIASHDAGMAFLAERRKGKA